MKKISYLFVNYGKRGGEILQFIEKKHYYDGRGNYHDLIAKWKVKLKQ